MDDINELLNEAKAAAARRAAIARETALAPSTVSSIVHELTACDLLAMEPEHGGRRVATSGAR